MPPGIGYRGRRKPPVKRISSPSRPVSAKNRKTRRRAATGMSRTRPTTGRVALRTR